MILWVAKSWVFYFKMRVSTPFHAGNSTWDNHIRVGFSGFVGNFPERRWGNLSQVIYRFGKFKTKILKTCMISGDFMGVIPGCNFRGDSRMQYHLNLTFCKLECFGDFWGDSPDTLSTNFQVTNRRTLVVRIGTQSPLQNSWSKWANLLQKEAGVPIINFHPSEVLYGCFQK